MPDPRGARGARGGGLRPGLAVTALGASLAAVAVALRPTRVAVTGGSMAPELAPGDRLLAVRALRYAVGDLVVVADPRLPRRLLVKRLVGRAGDRVSVGEHHLEAGPGAVVVLGDNPAASTDSRVLGPVRESAITGRCVYRYAPPARAGRLRRGVTRRVPRRCGARPRRRPGCRRPARR